jgi:hypothetical protein
MFALRGFGQNLFYAYDIANNIWIPKDNVRYPVSSGGSLAADGILGSDKVASNSDRLYAFTGNSTTHFCQYDPSNDRWNHDFVPAQPLYEVDRGADLAFGYWNDPAGPQRSGIWATFGNNQTRVGFYEPYVPGNPEGGQSMTSQPLPEPLRITQKSRNQISLNFASILKTDTRLKIYDASGKLALEFSIAGGKKEYSLDWSNTPSGIYYYRLIIENNEFKGKLVKN